METDDTILQQYARVCHVFSPAARPIKACRRCTTLNSFHPFIQASFKMLRAFRISSKMRFSTHALIALPHISLRVGGRMTLCHWRLKW